jgi:hypothetical protein
MSLLQFKHAKLQQNISILNIQFGSEFFLQGTVRFRAWGVMMQRGVEEGMLHANAMMICLHAAMQTCATGFLLLIVQTLGCL